jgi:cbb3-type cytochrome oxidase subunit 3
MNKAKIKKIGMMVLSIFGLVVVVAAFMRAKKQSDANASVKLTDALVTEIKSVTQTA